MVQQAVAKGVAFITCLILITIGTTYYYHEQVNTRVYNGITYYIADTEEKRVKGLSGREQLYENEAMLFIFREEAAYNFWMKDMNFSIDIIWISREGIVVHIEDNVSPASYPEIFGPDKPALYVVEGTSGFAARNGWTVGTSVALPI